MKTSTIAFLAAAGAATAAVLATDPCNMSAIQGSLLANGTTWHDSCAAATGLDVFMLSSLPTKAEAMNFSQSRGCVDYINQLNNKANQQIQCTLQVGDQTIVFAELLNDLATGQSSNKTKEATVGSDSMSGSVSLSSSDSASGSEATSESTSASESTSSSKSTSASSSSSGSNTSASADKQESSKNAATGSNAGVAVTASFSIAAAAATTVFAFAL
ncbi:unnamed protein product [Phytophthora lilii]|uniref:Unnamed protein product n=1 Tax=Phytophthora lilii TaxID=2077276 RepID=A0A9W6TC50_9STRA|nr:unnamed protein product [Phytophthora lilii]